MKEMQDRRTMDHGSDIGSHATPACPYYRTGVSLCMDEISQEEVACYFPHADSVGGLCREHCAAVDLRLRSFQSAVDIAEALDEERVHLGKEVSVLGLSSFGEDIRGALPLVISPTCKSERPDKTAEILRTVIVVYNDEFAKFFGPMWSFASDGDAGRRAMVYDMFMTNMIDLSHPLYAIVGQLPGLNLRVGDGDVTADFDWKHEIKRECFTCCLSYLTRMLTLSFTRFGSSYADTGGHCRWRHHCKLPYHLSPPPSQLWTVQHRGGTAHESVRCAGRPTCN